MLKSQYTEELLQVVRSELEVATAKYSPFNSTHEGYAIIKEEVDELWDGIKGNKPIEELKDEAIQVAAMAIRFCIDINDAT